jgi:RNase P/RNase MRP subunit POP5
MNYNINMDNAITESVNDNFRNAMLDHLTIRLQWEEFEDTKGIIRIRKSKKDRQLNGQK